jgi:sugar/nucleoside kinase (ribokinase family)
MKLAVAGHLVMDRIISVESLPEPDTSVAIKGMINSFGGTAGNLSIMTAQLGLGTEILSFVGSDFPEGYRRELKKRGIGTKGVIEVPGEKTPASVIISDGNGRQAGLFYQGAMGGMEAREIPERMLDAASKAEILHIGTGHPGFYEKLVDRLRERNPDMLVGFEPGQEIHYIYDENSLWNMLKRADIYFTNENEWRKTAELLNVRDEREILALTGTYVKTLGKEGSIIYTEKDEIAIPAVTPPKITDSTGCGDAYKGGFYAALGRKMPLEDAGRAGAAAASYVLEREGAQIGDISWEMIERRIDE